MIQNTCVFYLKVQRVEQACLFELSWGRGQQISVTLPYPENLTLLYQEWSAVYLSFYKQALRGRVSNIGSFAAPPVDWHAKLVQAEAKLLYEFHQWLRSAELFEIRSRIAQTARDGEQEGSLLAVEVFLTCNPIEVSRLPWEAWEIGTEFAAAGRIRIVRTPGIVQGVTVTSKTWRRRARVLAILGDDTGLNFQADRDAVRSLFSVADVQFIGWQPGKEADLLKREIVNTIIDEQGWDVLLFAGHSHETVLTGGELAIAPGVSLSLSELERSLKTAKERGLQFALFNSCNGLSLANALIDLGLSQVAVMREPIHNQVAQEFLVQFLQHLAQHKDVHESLLAACQYLKLEKHLTYPSAYLIPSLFRHADAPPFRIEPFGVKEKLKRWLPTKKEAIALAALVFASWQLPVQDFLLEQRVLAQAYYRQLTNQVPTTQQPPVLLVQIDEESIKKAGISDPKPMNRRYLAQIVDKLTESNTKVIGIDYLLDRYQKENDQKLAESFSAAVEKPRSWLVFGTKRKDGGGWFEILPEFANPNWSLQGDVMVLFGNQISHITLVPRKYSDSRNLPFSYLLALAYQLNFEQSNKPPQPQLQSSMNWLSELKAYVSDTTGEDYKEIFSPTARLQPLTNLSYQYHQRWLHPIIDFSIPPNRVYERLPAWQLLEEPINSLKLDSNQQPIVIIAAGGYGEAGAGAEGEDNFPVPKALAYWRSQENPPDRRQVFPGGEVHAYLTHHFLTQRLVVPIPDLWLLGIAVLLGKGTVLAFEQVKGKRQKKDRLLLIFFPSGKGKWILLMTGVTVIYGLASLQVYVTGAVLLPWFIPATAFWTYILLNLLESKSHV
ncbi:MULTISPECIES: CHASE2 domain-containing protein [unclassified Coleofasciculus]|uniref:CHASE2 domain-containing protein n=1 Tax=unclassified Coleofasciculus TaxID=2692782 RepID=UPI001881A9C3|nr:MULTISPECIES: CHASE2 domain-containing protein [unclassified Coleofasciculus]MBE9128376.1 CHASE2 domain-containing protein [Coleofasciculus sp. LEGE 07081]MBE9151432.1 CHASE2 domain-containing protein [Coleofasciculus sp. LEGE 07092]